jgi:transcriptional regulator with XRE-family HTH domain
VSRGVFGDELRRLRRKAGMTQEEVAAKARLTREYISELERGKYTPTIDVFIRLCRAVDASPAEVVMVIDKQMHGS